jgi:putative endonuclease
MPFYTYILISEITGRRYFGSCEDIEKRLKYHNAGKVRSTKAYRPYRVLYYETFESKSDALKREKFFKSVDGYRYLRNIQII